MQEFFEWAIDNDWPAMLIGVAIGNVILGWIVTLLVMSDSNSSFDFGIWFFGHIPAFICAVIVWAGFTKRDQP